MQRYFIDEVKVCGESVRLSAEDSHHLANVMRAKVGATIIIVTANHDAYVSEIVTIETKCVTAVLKEPLLTTSELPVEVTVACGLSKNDKIDTIVQKATECGMHQFIPLILQRNVVKWEAKKATQKIERLEKIAKEAAEQSHRTHIPTIQSLMNVTQLIEYAQAYDVKLIAYEETAKIGEHAQLKQQYQSLQPQQKILLVFGSEGGLTLQEVAQLEAAGFLACSLGPRILRAETAPIYALSALSYTLEL